MAISRAKKDQIVTELTEELKNSKLVAFASVDGLTVKQSQQLRKSASEQGITIKVVKNRLVKVAASKVPELEQLDTDSLKGQLIYAMSDDEVEPAKILAEFAKESGTIELQGAFTIEGQSMDQTQAKALAAMPSKDQLRGQLVGTIAAPLSGFVSVMAGTPRGLVNVLNAQKDKLETA